MPRWLDFTALEQEAQGCFGPGPGFVSMSPANKSRTAENRELGRPTRRALPGNAGHYKKTHLDDQIRLDAEKCMDSNGGS